MSDHVVSSGEDDDRRTFGPSASNRDVLELLVKQGHFKTSIGAFQAAAMFALRKGLDPERAPSSAGTMWNRGSVNLQVLEFLGWYLPTATPVRVLAQLGNAGTDYIASRVRSGGYTLSEIFELPEISVE
ncbi:hypothetical protein [Microbacterium sp.]|uniref:hypothetical protein n=1 Tax=Microbacterium sp. TaxID=51671 RepID=UPI0028113105|nr:hypothetical protein [Microbacterium sp.]